MSSSTAMQEGQLNRWSTGLSQKELIQLVDSSLGPTGSIWHQQRTLQRQHHPELLSHLTAETKPSDLAHNVGTLAKLGQFDGALELMGNLAKQHDPEALGK